MIKQDESVNWYAVRTRTRSEKWVVRQLEEKEIESWIPLRWSIRKYPGRIRKTQIPLINGYVFVRTSSDRFASVLETEGVFGFVQFANEIPTVPSEQIELLKFITGENMEITMTDQVMERGDQVEIIGGELTGLSGELIEFKGKNRVLMRMENVGLSFFIEVPKARLRKK